MRALRKRAVLTPHEVSPLIRESRPLVVDMQAAYQIVLGLSRTSRDNRRMIKLHPGSVASAILACVVLAGSGGVLSYGQSSSGAIRGSVLDPSGAAIGGATVEIANPVSHYQQSVKTNAQGAFQFANIPYNNYHLTATASGFQSASQDIDVRSAVAVR